MRTPIAHFSCYDLDRLYNHVLLQPRNSMIFLEEEAQNVWRVKKEQDIEEREGEKGCTADGW